MYCTLDTPRALLIAERRARRKAVALLSRKWSGTSCSVVRNTCDPTACSCQHLLVSAPTHLARKFPSPPPLLTVLPTSVLALRSLAPASASQVELASPARQLAPGLRRAPSFEHAESTVAEGLSDGGQSEGRYCREYVERVQQESESMPKRGKGCGNSVEAAD